ncbi:SDR family oxidoreductase [Aeromicrobium senzhongii]|uniref:SDR family oxidoreductase n=1 Tax=Aeromicrobium senzhongii TaxID=2663859 RepID=A0ABX6SWD8_9ACTN|nr:NAD(P)-binding oxidoreductase [Aeromicrobium senzhongii]MTB88250.1 NAD(P)H-binding protein [Aeromicrobium senzhongii]QNL94764.1 SDR family oxidoreductase [Aeromicrobium senzhongii]
MSDIAIVGGHGHVARLLIPLLTERGDLPVALVRNPDHEADLPGAAIRLLDIEAATVDDFATAFTDCDAVVFAAGGGPDGKIERKKSVDLEGSLKSIEAAERLGIKRFVQISAMGVDTDPGEDAGEVWQAYVEAKRGADEALRASSLDWTIIRPGALTDDDGTGRVTVAETTDRAEIPRADVAALVAAALVDDHTIGKQFEAIGGDTPIAEALASL